MAMNVDIVLIIYRTRYAYLKQVWVTNLRHVTIGYVMFMANLVRVMSPLVNECKTECRVEEEV